ncbi:PAS domain S-box protein [Maridesulfovibrio sp.]|uniref:PAS domain-containing sensor histidine kinase n=1 Tax=Maridesulfovibrio sp. TaxID=2795000 RepID=UPI002A18B095|nr:PAS domain S-box protein [Maridesulfovibrio sp.]
MKTRSIYKLNNRIRNYICLFVGIFIASSLLAAVLFFWSLASEAKEKAETWTNYFTDRMLFLESAATSQTTFEHGLVSVLKISPAGKILDSHPFPAEIKSIRGSDLYTDISRLHPGDTRILKAPVPGENTLERIYLVKRMDSCFILAEIPYATLLPSGPQKLALCIRTLSGDCIYKSQKRCSLHKTNISGLSFSGMHAFAAARTGTEEFGGLTVTVAQDISVEFYSGILLITLTLSCLAIFIKRSAYLTWDLANNEKDFEKIGELMGRVSENPAKNMNSLSAIEYKAEKIRSVDWQAEADSMAFTENKDYIIATASFARNILILLDNMSEHSRELSRSRKRYMDLVQLARSIILRMDREGNCTFFNEYAQSFFGFTEKEMLGNNIVGTIIPKTERGDSELEKLIDYLLKYPENMPTSTNLNIRKDGSSAWIFWTNTPVFDNQGRLTEVLSVGIDVTEQKQAEEELEKTRNYIRDIIDSMPSVIIGLNASGRITHFNSAALPLAVMSVEMIEGAEVGEAFPDIARYEERIKGAIRTGVAETGIRTEDVLRPGTFQEIIIYPLTGGAGGAVIRIDDITERVRMDEMMIQTEKMMSIGGLAAGMAHEINNPLGGILQGIQNIVRRLSPDLPANIKAADKAGCRMDAIETYMEDRKIFRTLEGITDSGVRAAEIVSGMLEFSRKSDSRKAPGDLRLIMDKAEVLAAQDYDLKKSYDFKSIKITKKYAEDLNMVKCTATEIEQVFLNLLRNSAQAMAEWKEMECIPEVTVEMRNQGRMVICSVSDNGPGMNEKTCKRIFEPFYTTKAPGSGTGLGLSVSYFIITSNHLGKFQVRSTPGQGTAFTITLPALLMSGTAIQPKG